MPSPIWSPATEFRLTAIAPELWVARYPLSFMGFKITAGMVLVRLPDGGLWVHSPIPLTDELKAAVDALGPVRFIVAPNRTHHLSALPWAKAYPDAQLYVAPGLTDKNPAFADYPLIPPTAEAPWASALDSVFVAGNTEMNETVFFHRASRTLIVSDLLVHMGPWDGLLTRLYARLTGCYGRVGQSVVLRKFYKDHGAARTSLAKVAAWDFDRIVLSHGPVIRESAKEIFKSAFAWLL